MRTHGTLTRWNDDRGFGFITPAKGDGDVFVHVSAFPRDGVRPRLNELVSFEIEAGPDGRRRAVRLMRPATAGARSSAAKGDRRTRTRTSLLGSLASLAAMAAIGVYGYSEFSRRLASHGSSSAEFDAVEAPSDARFACDGRTTCAEMTSCAEATYFIRHCPDTKMDGNEDGEPCESQWCN